MLFQGDFSNLSGERLVQKLNALLMWVNSLINAQKHDTTSGDLNRIPFYTSDEDVKSIQDNLDATGIELVALKDATGVIDIWVISKDRSYPLKGLLIQGSIKTINGVERDGTGNVELNAAGGLTITPDTSSNSILIDATSLKDTLLQSIQQNSSDIATNQNDINSNSASIASNTSAISGIQSTYVRDVTSPSGTISVSSPSTGIKNIAINPAGTSQILVSSAAGNTLTTSGTDQKLFVPTPPPAGVQTVTAGDTTITVAGTASDPTIAANTNAISPNLISTQANNSITSGTDGKLYAPSSAAGAGVESINSIKQNNIDIVAGSNVTITKTGSTGSESIQIASTGGSGGGSVNSVSAGDSTIVIGGTAADPTVAVSPTNTASALISSTTGNAIVQDSTDSKLFVPSQTSDAPFVRDAIYFDDTYTDPASDGTAQKPWKTLQNAVNDASTKGVNAPEPLRVIAKGSATRVNTEDITIGSPATAIGMTLDLQYLTLKGSIKVDASATITEDTNLLDIIVDRVERCNIEVINPQNIGSTTDPRSSGITVRLNARSKVAENDEETFTCDASGITTLKNNYITYVENIAELEEKVNANTTNVRASIHFILGGNTVQSQFTAESGIQSIANDTSGAGGGTIPYVGFTNSSGLIDPTNTTEVFIRDLKDNGQLYDMFANEGASEDSIVSAKKIDATEGLFNTMRVTNDLQVPVEISNTGTAGSVYFDPVKDAMYYINTQGQKIKVGGASNGVGEGGAARISMDGEAKSIDFTHTFRFPRITSKIYKESGTADNHIIDIPQFEANFRVVDKVVGSDTFPKQPSINDFDFSAGEYYGMGYLQVGGTASGITFFVAPVSTPAVNEHIATLTFGDDAEAQIFMDTIVEGCTITFTKDGTDKSCSCIVIEKTVSGGDSKVINIGGYFNFDHGENSPDQIDGADNDFKPLSMTAANTEAFDKIYLGDRFAFDPSKKFYQATGDSDAMGRETVSVHYHPVLIQDENNPTNNAVIFVGFNPRFASGGLAGERSFSLKHVSLEYLRFFKSKFASSQVAIQPLSMFIEGGIYNSATENDENASRRIRSCDFKFAGNSYTRTLRYGLEENGAGTPVHGASTYHLFVAQSTGDASKTISYGSSGTPITYGRVNNLGGMMASFVQDEMSAERQHVVRMPNLNTVNLTHFSREYFIRWSYTADPSTSPGSPDLDMDWTDMSTIEHADQLISLKKGSSEAGLPNGYQFIQTSGIVGPESAECWKLEGSLILTAPELAALKKVTQGVLPPPPIPPLKRVSRLSLLANDQDILMS